MTCYSPIPAYLRPDREDPTKNEVCILWRADPGQSELVRSRYFRAGWKLTQLPCGKCIGCRLDRANDWATRLTVELKDWNKNTCWFVTFTYDEDHILRSPEGCETVPTKKQFSAFLKRLRKAVEPQKFKFYAVAEYGSNYSRPHLHVIFYGLEIPDLIIHDPRKDLYNSAWLSSLWKTDPKQSDPNGFVAIQPVSYEACAYVARYCNKKLSNDAQEYYFRVPEWNNMSQGLGRRYLDRNVAAIFNSDSIPVQVGNGAQFKHVPRYFEKKLKEIDLDRYNALKAEREGRSVDLTEIMISRKRDSLDNILSQAERSKIEAIKTLKRNYENGIDIFD